MCLVATSVAAQDTGGATSEVTFSGGIGVIGIEAHEYVFESSTSDNRISHLIWQSMAPVLNAGFDIDLPDGWTVSASADVAMAGDSYMEDFDWLPPHFVSFDADDWTHRSQHPDTSLEWFFSGNAFVGYDVVENGGLTINLNAGFRYTDVQWEARGGTFDYSVGGFRDTSGTFPDGPGISYRQRFPTLLAGVEAELEQDQWTFTGTARAGVTIGAAATDHHWLRDLRFEDTLGTAPVISLSARAAYRVDDALELFAEGTLDKIFDARGDTDSFDIPTGALLGTSLGSAGAEFGSVSVKAGLKGTF